MPYSELTSDQNQHQQPSPSSELADLLLGHVQSVTGSQVCVGILTTTGLHRSGSTVGKFIKIHSGNVFVVGVIIEVSTPSPTVAHPGYCGEARVDLAGEISERTGTFAFVRGVQEYPSIGDAVTTLSGDELRVVFNSPGLRAIEIGHLVQDGTIEVSANVDVMLGMHFAVLGTTGVGKSSAVAHILRQMLPVRPDLRVLLLDLHNEYGRCLSEQAYIVNHRNLKLPFWLFNFEEIVDIFFSGRPGFEEEVEILAEVIPIAKAAYTQYRFDRPGLKKFDPKSIGYTVDTPVPYRLADLLMQIDDRMGKLENRSSRLVYHKLMTRIESVSNDPRYAFMFENANVGGDTMAEAISQLFRMPAMGKPVTVVELAGFPAEVVDAVVSVLCRIAFEFGLWSGGANRMLLVCEEAHRFAAADRSAGFGPTRRAIARLAKEGRKHGVFLGLVTQRPAELDPTIISQCSTLFAMRMTNERDQELIRSAVSDSWANLFAFLPSLGMQEALAFGVGVPLPTRMRFAALPNHLLPKSEAFATEPGNQSGGEDLNFIGSVIERWRSAVTSPKPSTGEEARDPRLGTAPHLASVPEDTRFGLLKRPLIDRLEPAGSFRSPASPVSDGRPTRP